MGEVIKAQGVAWQALSLQVSAWGGLVQGLCCVGLSTMGLTQIKLSSPASLRRVHFDVEEPDECLLEG